MYLHIAIPRPVEDVFTYRCPPELEEQASIGKRVIVQFGRQKVTGFITSISEDIPHIFSSGHKKREIKPVLSILDTAPLIDETMLALCKWASEYYLFPFGMVLKTALSGIPEDKAARYPKKIHHILDMYKGSEAPHPQIKNTGGGLGEAQNSLPFKGRVRVGMGSISDGYLLTEAQTNVLLQIKASIAAGEFRVHLLHGVTGSGKTEVYMNAIEENLKNGKAGIVLVPEIALTPQLISRFVNRFGERVAVLHSGLTHSERQQEWVRIAEGGADVVIGVRSAVFAPVKNPGIIIIDEEHEHSYKQEDGFRYNARDLAIMRAKLSGAVAVLGSATPSLESYYNAEIGKYIYLSMPERINKRPLPPVKIIDLRKQGFSVITQELLEALKQRLTNGEQSLLFLNRRGFSPFLLCLDCGHTPLCVNCSVSPAFHKKENSLHCHYCDYRMPPPAICPQCNGTKFKAFGAGTERVEEELKKLIPEIRIERMDRDTTSKRHSHHRIFKSMENREADVLIGTQMVTKGLDLPGITLVGVLLADASLHLPDFRSAERTFQFITQVAGRSGRGDTAGEVIVQTFSPDHYSILYASNHDYQGFYKEESAFRKALSYPPYKRIVRILIKGINQESVETASNRFKEIIDNQKAEGIDVLGPVPAPFMKLRNKFRRHIIMKGSNPKSLNNLIRNSLQYFHKEGRHGNVQIEVDVDPMSLL
ncbi:MAG: primosomal protein N' [Nitrospirae bacterium]|nr:primosomal protein N' [Nitrospirota bacterium]